MIVDFFYCYEWCRRRRQRRRWQQHTTPSLPKNPIYGLHRLSLTCTLQVGKWKLAIFIDWYTHIAHSMYYIRICVFKCNTKHEHFVSFAFNPKWNKRTKIERTCFKLERLKWIKNIVEKSLLTIKSYTHARTYAYTCAYTQFNLITNVSKNILLGLKIFLSSENWNIVILIHRK